MLSNHNNFLSQFFFTLTLQSYPLNPSFMFNTSFTGTDCTISNIWLPRRWQAPDIGLLLTSRPRQYWTVEVNFSLCWLRGPQSSWILSTFFTDLSPHKTSKLGASWFCFSDILTTFIRLFAPIYDYKVSHYCGKLWSVSLNKDLNDQFVEIVDHIESRRLSLLGTTRTPDT